MGRRTVAIIAAIILALGAAALVWWYSSSVRTNVSEGEVTQAVLVAAEDIPARTTGDAIVQKGLAQTVQVPQRLVAPGALLDVSALQGKVLTSAVAKGQQLVDSQLGTPETEGAVYRIKKGMRAISVPIDRARGLGGEIQAGDKVDILATFEYEKINRAAANTMLLLSQAESDRIKAETEFDPATSQGDVTRVALQQIEVLSIDSLAATTTGGGLTGSADTGVDEPVITLMVTPADAEILVFAEELGKLWFALVPSDDADKVTTPGRAVFNEFPR